MSKIILPKYSKTLNHLYLKGLYTYQECVKERGLMHRLLKKKKKIDTKLKECYND